VFKGRAVRRDGFYQQNKDVVATGMATGDSRLSGEVRIKWDEFFNLDVDPSTGEAGTFVGSIVIRDPMTGKKKMQGTFHTAGPPDMVQGVIVGEVLAEGNSPGEARLRRPDRPLAGHLRRERQHHPRNTWPVKA
jgi:hypothetical protein